MGAPKRGIGEGLIAIFGEYFSLEKETDGEGALVNHYYLVSTEYEWESYEIEYYS